MRPDSLNPIVGILVISIQFFVGFLLAGPSMAEHSPAPKGQFRLVVEGLTSDDGRVRIGLFQTKESYLRRDDPYDSAHLAIQNRQCEWVIDQLPYGEYAVMLYHDQNGNGKMDKNWIGLPLEPYGFSNNARPRLGAPSFRRVKFPVNQKVQTLRVRVR